MPITKSALKKKRADVKKSAVNKKVKSKALRSIKAVKKNPTAETLKAAFSAIDRAIKGKIFKERKGNRLKSRISKLPAPK